MIVKKIEGEKREKVLETVIIRVTNFYENKFLDLPIEDKSKTKCQHKNLRNLNPKKVIPKSAKNRTKIIPTKATPTKTSPKR